MISPITKLKLNSIYIRALFVITTVSLPTLSQAIDTDIYVSKPGGVATTPNLLFLLDNTANWSNNSSSVKKQQVEHEALFRFVDEIINLNTDSIESNDVAVNLGLMLTTHSNNPMGGKPYQHFINVQPNDPNSISSLKIFKSTLYCNEDLGTSLNSECKTALRAGEASWTSFNAWIETKSKQEQDNVRNGTLPTANKAKYATSFYEAYNYYAGNAPFSGKADGNGSFDPEAFLTTGEYDTPIKIDKTNKSAEYCAKNHIVFIGNGGPSSGENTTAEEKLTLIDGNTNIIPISPDGYQSNWADEYARFLATTDVNKDVPGTQTITSHVVNVFDPVDINTAPERSAVSLLESIARQGKGEYKTASNVEDLVTSMLKILSTIQAVNDVFAASALPVSVNVRGTNLNQVYIGVFRPDGEARPRWNGNMKMYRLAYNEAINYVYLSDADGAIAANSSTGFINDTARSFWTHDSSFWTYIDTTRTAEGVGGASDSPDGDLVEKGAVAQSIRDTILDTSKSRRVLTCQGCATDSKLESFDKTILPTKLGLVTINERDTLVDWVSGLNVHENDADADRLIASASDKTVPTKARASVHGDVLHSRPAVINYGDKNKDGQDDVYVFYGANDGALHAVQGGTNELATSNDGQELWAFIPEEHFPKLKELYDNNILASQADKPFFVDGTIGSYVEMTGDEATKVILYLTMRRGGEFIYALDVSDPNDPKFLWKKSSLSAGYGELGQTWSAPIVSKLKIENIDRNVLIFGLGYDALANDGFKGRTIPAAKGRGIAVVDAFSGDLIWQAGPTGTKSASFLPVADLKYAVSADLSVIDRDRNGYADRLYFGDTGGQLWRADIFDGKPENWKLTKLLSLSGGQKFLSAPNIAASTDPLDPYDAVVISSGDRENPFDETVENYIFVIKDYDYSAKVASNVTTALTLDNLTNAANSQALYEDTNKITTKNGWYIPLLVGEKGISKPAIVNSIVFINTFQPGQAGQCSASLGTARTYQFDFMTSKATSDLDNSGSLEDGDRFNVVEGGGLIPDPVAVIVEIDGKLVEAIISGTNVEQFPNTLLQKRRQTYWMKNID